MKFMDNAPDKINIADLPLQALHSLVVQNSGDYGIVVSNLEGRIVGWNPSAEKILGWSAAEAIGLETAMFFIPEERATGIHQMEMKEAAECGVAEDQRWHLKRDGMRLWVVGQLTRLSLDGKHLGYAKILRDRTAERLTEERLRIAQLAGAVGTFELEIDNGIITPSEQFCSLWGVPLQRNLNLNELQSMVHPDDRQRVIDSYADMQTGELDYIEYRIMRRGTHDVRWLARRGELVLDENTGGRRYLGVNYDISELKSTEESLYAANAQLRASEARYREFAELAPAIVWFCAPDGSTTYLNRQWNVYTGMGPGTIPPDGWHAAVHPDDIEAVMNAWNQARAEGSVFEIEARLRRHDGIHRWHLMRAQPRHDGGDSITGWIGIATDIHERKATEIILRGSEQRKAFVLSLGDQLRELTEPNEVLSVASEALAGHLHVNRAGYAAISNAKQARYAIGWTDGSVPALTPDLPFRAIGMNNLTPLQLGEILVFEDTAADPRTNSPTDRAAQEELGIRALIVQPELKDGELWSVHFVSHSMPRAWTADEVALIAEVSRRAWATVDSLRAARELERKVETAIAERDRIWIMSPDILSVIDRQGNLKSVNPAVSTILGWTPDEAICIALPDLVHPDDYDKTVNELARLFRERSRTFNFENRLRHKNGSFRWLSWTAVLFEEYLYASARDVSDIKTQAAALQQAEAALRQSQKMEAVGKLTGGIAHDFNNLLQGITGPLELMRRHIQIGRAADLDRYIKTAMESANRAAALTHRLLAFSRRQALVPKRINANQLIASMVDLLRRTMGESIQVEVNPAPDLWIAQCDANQLENALLNLAINARDAMPDGGRLTLETANVTLTTRNADRHPDLVPGEYIVISVSDTGTGMPEDVAHHAFDPFYTTKPIGKGTGLGLSMTYGFAKQSGGIATLYSEPGHGTTVKLYLPRDFGEPEKESAPHRPSTIPDHGGNRTILVVEDNQVVRQMIDEVLREIGYQVLQAADSAAALATLESGTRIDMLVTDLGLPGMSGRELADLVKQSRPDIKILLMTGYAEGTARDSRFLTAGMEMITKPFTLDTFIERIRRIIDGDNTPV